MLRVLGSSVPGEDSVLERNDFARSDTSRVPCDQTVFPCQTPNLKPLHPEHP